jgi:coniferyl-aldehyde dehydrogenase
MAFSPVPRPEDHSSEDTSLQLTLLCAAQRQAFLREGPPDYARRRENLNKLLELALANEQRIADAISQDFGHRSRFETALAEIFVVISGIKHASRNLKGWMKPKRVATAFYFWPGKNRIIPQPLGVVGVISPWNYPFYLSFSPVTSALAAGNRVVLKPSELTPKTSELFKEMVASAFAPNEFAVVTGGRDVGVALSKAPLDHLFFTGSTKVGREVAIAAAHNLTPATLELGGKSPALVSDDYPISRAAERIVIGKMINCGQTCIAPDYVLVPEPKIEDFVAAVRAVITNFYPSMGENPDYTSIINSRNLERLNSYLDDARQRGVNTVEINPATESLSRETRKMPLYLVINPPQASIVMQEEIFGPILPVLGYRSIDDAIAYINAHPRPLALYYFGNDARTRDKVLRQTISGGATVNDTLWHICQESLPFGGVGNSGIGSSHGIHGFTTFSKEKGVFYQAKWAGAKLLNPPFGRVANRTLDILRKIF